MYAYHWALCHTGASEPCSNCFRRPWCHSLVQLCNVRYAWWCNVNNVRSHQRERQHNKQHVTGHTLATYVYTDRHTDGLQLSRTTIHSQQYIHVYMYTINASCITDPWVVDLTRRTDSLRPSTSSTVLLETLSFDFTSKCAYFVRQRKSAVQDAGVKIQILVWCIHAQTDRQPENITPPLSVIRRIGSWFEYRPKHQFQSVRLELWHGTDPTDNRSERVAYTNFPNCICEYYRISAQLCSFTDRSMGLWAHSLWVHVVSTRYRIVISQLQHGI